MRKIEDIYDIYLDEISSFRKRQLYLDENFCLDEENIKKCINDTEKFYSDVIPDIVLLDDEKDELTKKIKSLYEVYQDEGSVILGDYEHDYSWHDNLISQSDYDAYYWNRYKNYLLKEKHFSPNIVNTLEDKTLKSLMSYIGNPRDSQSRFSVRGLVVGDVQSGKTSNYLGLISRAADAGYKVIILLTGTIESLRKQTQIRTEEGFVGFDSSDGLYVGVGSGSKMPISFTSRENDFTGKVYQNTSLKISDNKESMIFVIKKNASVLKKLYSSLKKINTVSEHNKINYPLILIDDEADNASINTNKIEDDPTKINKLIRNILDLFLKNTYVGFTATPFANVFICYDDENDMVNDDLFPRDFIYALKSPSNYQGSKKYFFEANNNVKIINDFDEEILPLKHKKEWCNDILFDSFYHAIRCFLIINAIRDIRDTNPHTDRSMLINMSRFCKVQDVIKDITIDYFSKILRDVKLCQKYSLSYALTNDSIKELKESFDKEFSQIRANGSYLTFDDVFEHLYESIKDIKIQVVNSRKNSEKLKYEDKNGTRVIAIGGLALSRGLTLEGLCVSYFYRNSSTFDVLMQMGRWFGYRDGYDDLIKIFMTKESIEYYKDICLSIECLKDEIDIMGKQHKKPKDYGIRVRNDSEDLKITAANKMRSTKIKVDRKSFYGNLFETPYLHRDLDIIEGNINCTLELLSKIDKSQRDQSVYQHPYFRDVEKEKIIDFLTKLNVHEANEGFDIKQILKFLRRSDESLDKFDVLTIGGSSNNHFKYPKLDIDIPLVVRKYDIKDNDIIRMNAKRAHLWGRSDAKYGLDKDIQDKISEHARAQDYLVEDRNPLLVIYFVEPKNEFGSETYDYKYDTDEGLKLDLELMTRRYSYLVGFSIGFPSKQGENEESTIYVVNKTVNYYDKHHEEDDEDGNE